jgi:CubicO group peptidase (beta-lactamase class C family)
MAAMKRNCRAARLGRVKYPNMSRFWFALSVGLLAQLNLAFADRVDDYIQTQMADHRIPGLALLILQSNQPIKKAVYGLANVELKVPVTPETVFEIGSITKQFTAATILLLARDGRLSVEDKINRYLGHLPPTWQSITVRHLLTHTSGIKSYTGLKGFELTRHLTQEQFIEAIGVYPLEFQPGEEWKYCNTGYNLLGFIVENVSGEPYWNFLSKRILQPLGMTSTTNRLPANIIFNRAAGYEQTNHLWMNRDYDLTDVFSAGALLSTMGDLAKWNASLDASTLLDARTEQQMWTPTRLNNGTLTKYGLGWNIDQFRGHSNIGHGGSTSGFSATLQRFPDDHLAIIILTNTDEQIATTLARQIATFYFSNGNSAESPAH